MQPNLSQVANQFARLIVNTSNALVATPPSSYDLKNLAPPDPKLIIMAFAKRSPGMLELTLDIALFCLAYYIVYYFISRFDINHPAPNHNEVAIGGGEG